MRSSKLKCAKESKQTVVKIEFSQNMIKIANGFCDLCVPYNEKKEVMLDIFNELIEGTLFID
jgi:hypothetical protein